MKYGCQPVCKNLLQDVKLGCPSKNFSSLLSYSYVLNTISDSTWVTYSNLWYIYTFLRFINAPHWKFILRMSMKSVLQRPLLCTASTIVKISLHAWPSFYLNSQLTMLTSFPKYIPGRYIGMSFGVRTWSDFQIDFVCVI